MTCRTKHFCYEDILNMLEDSKKYLETQGDGRRTVELWSCYSLIMSMFLSRFPHKQNEQQL